MVPGQPIAVKVSTPARGFDLSVALVTATGARIVYRRTGNAGHDWRSRAVVDPTTHAVRARWPTALSVPTDGFMPGIYVITAKDSNRTLQQAIVVVRTPVLDSTKPAFVYDAMTQAAYNRWGGWAFYEPQIATTVTFDRPLWQNGLGVWTRADSRLVPWLLARWPDLQFTTDEDLSTAAPPSVPETLIFGFHTEYVTAALLEWVRQQATVGRHMNVAIFGANSFYWKVRLEPGPTPDSPPDMTCFKLAPADDPLAQTAPTGRFRDLGEAEGSVLGAQYSGIVGSGRQRFDTTVTATIPPDLLTGTGWRAGTVLHGLVFGEGDATFAGSGSIVIAATSGVRSPYGTPIRVEMSVRPEPGLGRIFDAGTFAFADGLSPARVSVGVAPGSFDRFADNILTWLDVSAH